MSTNLRRPVFLSLLAIIAGLSGCASYQIAPDECPTGTQKLEGCPPLGAIDDPGIATLFADRTWVDPDELEVDAVQLGRDAKIPINSADAKFIGSTDAGGLTSLAAKIWLIENAEHTVDVMYYIFTDDLIGYAVLGALCDAVQRGVDVRIMVDSLGSIGMNKKHLKALESCAIDAGFMRTADGQQTIYKARVQAAIFNAISRIFVNHNRRSHDKLLVIDGHFDNKAAIITGGRNISLAYYGILEDGSPNPHTYRDAEIFLRGGKGTSDEDYTVGMVSEIYFTILFEFKNNKRTTMSRMGDPRQGYSDERQLFRDNLATLKSLPVLQEYFDLMPRYVAEEFHTADVLLAHEISNLTDKRVVSNAIENSELNPNSITTVLAKIDNKDADNLHIVSPYLFAALFKDDDGNVLLDEAKDVLDWLDQNPQLTINIVTNSVLTSDNFSAQSIIDMDLAPRLLLSPEKQEQWLQKLDESEFNVELVESEEWVSMVNHPRLLVYETGKLDDKLFGGDYEHAKLHAKYIVGGDIGFVGTSNFDYRSRLYNNEMGFFFDSQELADDVRENTDYLTNLSYRWGSPDWLEMRRQLMEMDGSKSLTARKQRTIYKTLKSTGLHWWF
jgi:phosphatidylserine/phosphatidylglycerophosphate/cardiolipin synthase-like enzyme